MIFLTSSVERRIFQAAYPRGFSDRVASAAGEDQPAG